MTNEQIKRDAVMHAIEVCEKCRNNIGGLCRLRPDHGWCTKMLQARREYVQQLAYTQPAAAVDAVREYNVTMLAAVNARGKVVETMLTTNNSKLHIMRLSWRLAAAVAAVKIKLLTTFLKI